MDESRQKNKTKVTRISVLSSKGHYMEERRRYRHEVMGKKDIVFLSAESAKGITLKVQSVVAQVTRWQVS